MHMYNIYGRWTITANLTYSRYSFQRETLT
jgi:hypothetical protein